MRFLLDIMAKKNKPEIKPLKIQQKVMIDVTKKMNKGLFKTEEERDKYYSERLNIRLSEELEKYIDKSSKKYVVGLISGAILSFLGGMTASSLIWWASEKNTAPYTSLVIAVACGVAFCIGIWIGLGPG